MKLINPFFISARLAPAVRIGQAVLSFDSGSFVIDLPDGSEHKVVGFRGPAGRVKGVNDTPESYLQSSFGAILSFLSACAESRQYAVRRGADAMDGESAGLFPDDVGEWAESVSDELSVLSCYLDETRGLICADISEQEEEERHDKLANYLSTRDAW